MRGKELTVEDRNDTLCGIRGNLSNREIATRLGRNPSVISREITRNGGRDNYRVHAAQEWYETLKSRPKERKLEQNKRLHDEVAEKLRDDFSPEQISARLKQDYSDDPGMRVSAETIYQALFLQARGELRTQLKLALRTRSGSAAPARVDPSPAGQDRRHGHHQRAPGRGRRSAVPGHGKGNLIIGKNGKSQIAIPAPGDRTPSPCGPTAHPG